MKAFLYLFFFAVISCKSQQPSESSDISGIGSFWNVVGGRQGNTSVTVSITIDSSIIINSFNGIIYKGMQNKPYVRTSNNETVIYTSYSDRSLTIDPDTYKVTTNLMLPEISDTSAIVLYTDNYGKEHYLLVTNMDQKPTNYQP